MARFPRFQDEFLESVSVAFQKRQKSFSHRASDADVAKVYERRTERRGAEEYLEIWLVAYDSASLRLWAWPDRFIRLEARRPMKKGLAWSWAYDGRLLGERSASEVIAALEETYGLFYEMEASRTNAFSGPWERLLARGPQAIRLE
jgi:hypothetical protein